MALSNRSLTMRVSLPLHVALVELSIKDYLLTHIL